MSKTKSNLWNPEMRLREIIVLQGVPHHIILMLES